MASIYGVFFSRRLKRTEEIESTRLYIYEMCFLEGS